MSHQSEPKKRHCMVVFATYPVGETRVQREAEVLIRHGYEVDVICLRTIGSLPVDTYKGVTIYREEFHHPQWIKLGAIGSKFLKYIIFLFTAAFRLVKLHRQKLYGTIQVHNLPDFLVFCAIIPKMLGVPIILDLHDLMPEFFAGRFGNAKSIPARLIRFQERLSCRFADHVITVSEHWRQALIHRGVPEQKCSVVMNVADENIFHPMERAHADPIRKNCFRLIYHGTLVERYGLDLAIQAVDRVKAEIPGIHLSLVGYGDYVPQLKQMIAERGLERHVTITDTVVAEDLPEMILSCHLGIVAYRNDVFTDGLLPTKLMEYAALGLPAIASRTTSIEGYFSDANAELFPPGDVDALANCILFLFRNPDRMAELARGSQKFNQRYNWVSAGAEYVALVEKLRMGNRKQ